MSSNLIQLVQEFEDGRNKLQLENNGLKEKLKSSSMLIDQLKGELEKKNRELENMQKQSPLSYIKIYDQNDKVLGSARIEATTSGEGTTSSRRRGRPAKTPQKISDANENEDCNNSQDDENNNGKKVVDNDDQETVEDTRYAELEAEFQEIHGDSLKVMDTVWINYKANDDQLEYIFKAQIMEMIDDDKVVCKINENDYPGWEGSFEEVVVSKSDCLSCVYDDPYVPIFKTNSTLNPDDEMKVGSRIFAIFSSDALGPNREYYYEGEIKEFVSGKKKVMIHFDEDEIMPIPVSSCYLHPTLNKSGKKFRIFKHVEYHYSKRLSSSLKKRKLSDTKSPSKASPSKASPSKTTEENDEDDEFESPSKMSRGNNEEEERLYNFVNDRNLHRFLLDYINSNYDLIQKEADGTSRKKFADKFREDMKRNFQRMQNEEGKESVKSEFLTLLMTLFDNYNSVVGGFMKHVKLVTNCMEAFEKANVIFFKSFMGKSKYLLKLKESKDEKQNETE